MPKHPDREAILARCMASLDAHAAGMDPGGAEAMRGFARGVLSQLRTAAVVEMSPEGMAALVADAYSFQQGAGEAGKLACTPNERGVTVRSVMKDQPFIVDTIRSALRNRGAQSISGFNVVGKQGEVSRSIVSFQAEGLDPASAAEVQEELAGSLGMAQAMVADFEAMLSRVDRAADELQLVGTAEADEGAAFLRWLVSDNFVFMGVTAADGRLGADRAGAPDWPAADLAAAEAPIRVRKTDTESRVHRDGRVDLVFVTLPSGSVAIRGMFTHRALTQPCRHLPILRRVLENVLAETRARPNSYRYRGLANMFDALPTEWLLSARLDEIRDVLDRVFDADQDQVARVHIAQQDDGKSTFTLVALPERRYSDGVRSRILAGLGRLTGATYTDSGLFAGRFDSVLLQVYQTGTRRLSADDVQQFERYVVDLATPWADRIEPVLSQHFGDEAVVLARKYGEAFPPEYGDETTGDQAVRDIRMLEASASAGRVLADIVEHQGEILLRVYQAAGEVTLTELMPVIDNFGLVISDQWSVSVHPRGSRLGAIDVFRVSGAPGLAREELLDRAANLVAGLDAVFRKDITSDPFNKLLLRANLQWAQADLVRGYIGYAKQLRLHHPIPRIQEILLKQAGTVRAIIDLFAAKFDPDLPGDRSAAIAQADAAVHDRLRAIRTADEDTVLRFLYNLVEATLRTNFFRSDRVAHYISVKCDHAKIRVMPMPRLMVEVYVHHREMEGVHLRGGPIARGGIRFSDRADFRTEILGLVTTQMVKNVVIVPEGSKGGFYIKYTIDDPAERRRKGDELYQFLMRGLLDVTDNIVEGKVVRPPRVVAHDGDDPYLVVAADKGTAHLSDTANRISLSYGFWLGDAFASGGSNGYDHKVVGITARGGWVLVKRHFREMGMDADKDPFTCIGIGDCGGDVFGNGVIETKVMQLRAAFNHLHIFLDPSPDMERSYAERRRLFDEVKGWEHYDKALLSPGGGVYDRKAKSVTLSPEAVAMLGAPQAEMTPDAVVNLILKMEVDLFWNGGIGTYVRASFETNSNCNDPPNDDVRVSAPELRCKIVGEGGNLGFTQAARIEYALHGGRLNTDFVDNSGGVDTSDHEVNIKILLNPMVRAGRFAEPERNDIIRSLTDEVAEAVLADSNANGRLISLDVIRSQRDPFPYSRAIDWICQKGNVDRHFLVLPTDDDLKRRAAARQGLVRPELAVIQAHVKMHVYKLLLQEDPAIIPGFDQLLQGYFPADLRSRFAADIPGHMLSRAIGMTTLLTEVATDAGAPFFPLMLELTGRSAGTIAGAWMEAMRITGGGDLKAALVAARAKPEGAHIAWTLYTDAITSLVTHWLSPGSRGPGAEDPARFRAALGALAKNRLPAGVAAAAHATEHLVNRGIPAALARGIVDAASGVSASEVCALSDGGDIEATATRYQALGHASGLVPLLAAIATRKAEGRWDPIALGILRLRYTALLRDLYRSGVPADSSVSKSVAALVEGVLGYNADVAALLVGEQRIRAVMA